jgi:hypothetical protein
MVTKQLMTLTEAPDPDDMDLVFSSTRSFVQHRWPNRQLIQVDLHLDNGKAIQLPVPDAFYTEMQKTGGKQISGAASSEPERTNTVSHSPDFRSLSWFGTEYFLTEKQAKVVKALWEAREKGSPDVAQEFLLRACDSDGVRLVDLFRRSPAWGSLIVSCRRGAYRLPDPPENRGPAY